MLKLAEELDWAGLRKALAILEKSASEWEKLDERLSDPQQFEITLPAKELGRLSVSGIRALSELSMSGYASGSIGDGLALERSVEEFGDLLGDWRFGFSVGPGVGSAGVEVGLAIFADSPRAQMWRVSMQYEEGGGKKVNRAESEALKEKWKAFGETEFEEYVEPSLCFFKKFDSRADCLEFLERGEFAEFATGERFFCYCSWDRPSSQGSDDGDGAMEEEVGHWFSRYCDLIGSEVELELTVSHAGRLFFSELPENSVIAGEDVHAVVGHFEDYDIGEIAVHVMKSEGGRYRLGIEDTKHGVLGSDEKSYAIGGLEFVAE